MKIVFSKDRSVENQIINHQLIKNTPLFRVWYYEGEGPNFEQ